MKIRVLQIVQKPQRRGAEIFAADLAHWLRKRGHAVTTVYLYDHVGTSGLALAAGDQQLRGVEKSALERFPGWQPSIVKALLRQIRGLQPDIVLANGARTVKYGALVRVLDKGCWKLVYRNIDSPRYWLRGEIRRGFYRLFVMRKVQGVVGVSRATLAEAVDLYDLKVPSAYIPRGVDFERLGSGGDRVAERGRMGAGPLDVVVLFCGSLTPQKRPDRYLRIMSKLSADHPQVRGLVLGDGPLRGPMGILTKELGLADRIRFLGYQADVAPFLKAADIHLSTSDSEGTPGSVLEASFFGLPTVAANVGGTHECIRDGETGYLVPRDDEDAYLAHLRQLVLSADARSRLGREAHSLVVGSFAMEVVGQAYEAFYQRLLSPPAEAVRTGA